MPFGASRPFTRLLEDVTDGGALLRRSNCGARCRRTIPLSRIPSESLEFMGSRRMLDSAMATGYDLPVRVVRPTGRDRPLRSGLPTPHSSRRAVREGRRRAGHPDATNRDEFRTG